MRTKNTLRIISPKELKNFEIVDPNVSKKYVPIFTSEIIELLKSEFTFVDGLKFRNGSSAHYVNLQTEEGDILRLYNSYDRTLVLSISYISEGFGIPLGINRLIHIGSKAKGFTDNIKEAKQDILKAIETTKKVKTFLTNMTIEKDIAEVVTETIFQLPKSKEAIEVINPIDTLIGKVSIAEYIKKSINSYLTG